jgi:hypothetical protein
VTIFIDFNHRDIRSAEKVFRRKVLDIYAAGIDYWQKWGQPLT